MGNPAKSPCVVVAMEMLKKAGLVSVEDAVKSAMVKSASGVVVPTPTLPLISKVVDAIREVDEAKIPPRAQSGVVVAAVVVPKTVVVSNG